MSSDPEQAPPTDPASPTRTRRPWWIPFFLGAIPDVDAKSLTLLGTVGLAVFFEAYDLSLLTSALSFIAADLEITEETLGLWTGLIRLGGLPAFALLPFADRFGRRKVFLASLLGLSLATLASAFSPTILVFALLQMLARVSFITFSATAIVIISEEFPAKHRGWGMGIFGALGALGYGLSAILFSQIEVLPGGWRALYLVGAAPLLFLPVFLRNVPETRRFAEIQQQRDDLEGPTSNLLGWAQPIRDLFTTYPQRMVGVTLACFIYAASELAVMQFVPYFILEEHGWEPWQYSALILLGGLIPLWANVAAGRLGDRFGRRPVGMAVMSMLPLGAICFFHVSSDLLAIFWIILSFGSVAANVMLRAIVTESFPTSQRSTAAGWMTLTGTVGAALGLWSISWGQSMGFTLPTIESIVSCFAIIAGLALFLLPETRGLELEEISDDPHAAPQAARQGSSPVTSSR